MRTTSFILVFMLVALNTSAVSAQNADKPKVVVIPLAGNDVVASAGVTYSALAPIVISTPDLGKPDEQVISFTSPADDVVSIMQPSLGINYVIALQGLFPSRSLSGNPVLGGIGLFAGNFAPRGWAFCSGQLLSIAQNPALFSILGTTYGGDGRTTFGLPDLRGRAAIGVGNGPGLSSRVLGQRLGSERLTINHR